MSKIMIDALIIFSGVICTIGLIFGLAYICFLIREKHDKNNST